MLSLNSCPFCGLPCNTGVSHNRVPFFGRVLEKESSTFGHIGVPNLGNDHMLLRTHPIHSNTSHVGMRVVDDLHRYIADLLKKKKTSQMPRRASLRSSWLGV